MDGAETASRLRALDAEVVAVVTSADLHLASSSRAAFAAGAMFVAMPQNKEEMRIVVDRARAESSVGRIDAAAHGMAEEHHLPDELEFLLRRAAHGESRQALMKTHHLSPKAFKKLASTLVQALGVRDLDAAVKWVRLRATAPGIAAGMVPAPPPRRYDRDAAREHRSARRVSERVAMLRTAA
jgi:hypothetical protein